MRIVLAAAGLRRLGFADRISLTLPASACVPAPGQGIVAIETRERDDDVRRTIEAVSDDVAKAALTAERAVVDALGGGCQTPVGALASPTGSAETRARGRRRLRSTAAAIVRAHGRGPMHGAATHWRSASERG